MEIENSNTKGKLVLGFFKHDKKLKKKNIA